MKCSGYRGILHNVCLCLVYGWPIGALIRHSDNAPYNSTINRTQIGTASSAPRNVEQFARSSLLKKSSLRNGTANTPTHAGAAKSGHRAAEGGSRPPGGRSAGLQNLIQQQPHLNPRMDDQYLVAFLRGCKYSLERAKSKLDRFYTLRTKYPELFRPSSTTEGKFREIHQTG